MKSSRPNRDREWHQYYHRFNYFSASAVRDGCQPRIYEHENPVRKAIVLVHGLTDSPYYMTDIGRFFFNELGYNVYLPLLHLHGLKAPEGMEAVNLEEWKRNVIYAVESAVSKATDISIGGLSMGGTLSFHTALKNQSINGAIYLFSATFGLAGGILGDIKERILRSFIVDFIDDDKPLIGEYPYRYSRINLEAARELSILIKEIETLLNQFSPEKPLFKKLYAAHSECDTTADITGIENLKRLTDPEKFRFIRIPEKMAVPHASLVLKSPIYRAMGNGCKKVLEPANSMFDKMMKSISLFSEL